MTSVKIYFLKLFLFCTENLVFDHIGYFFFKIILSLTITKNRNKNQPKLFWGPVPILNNKYWSNSLNNNFYTKTIMDDVFHINSKNDFDLYSWDILNQITGWPSAIKFRYRNFFLTYYIIKHFDIFHIPFSGAFLGNTRFWKKEPLLWKRYNKKIVVIPYGSDAYMYSRIKDESFQNSLLISYPELAKNEAAITEKVRFWEQHADFLNGGFIIDGMARWDVPIGNYVVVDTNKVAPCDHYSEADGVNGAVIIAHSPNHRGVKGTEFLIEAVERLKMEGLKIELILIENRKNSEVLEILHSKTDILVEQLIFGYGLSAIEGMSSGVAVVSNLSLECYTRPFRRYSYLNECPILSATPESIKQNLKILVRNPELRMILGQAGRKYVEKYHSESFAKFLFSKVYDKIWYNKEVDLMSMFHPLNPDSYNNKSPKIDHPLIENKLPSIYL